MQALLTKILAALGDLRRRIIRIEAHYDYVANGIDDTAGIQAMIDLAVAEGKSAQMVVRGSAALWDTLWVTGLGRNSSLTVMGDVIPRWDPADPDNSLHAFIGGEGNKDNPCAPGFRLRWTGKFYWSPELTWEGFVETVDPSGLFYDVRCKPTWLPAFDTMNTVHIIENDVWTATQFEFRGRGSQLNYPCAVQPSGLLRVSPPLITGTATTCTLKNPLEFTFTGGNLYDGMAVSASGFGGLLVGGVSILNGVSGLTLAIDDDYPTRAQVLKDGVLVDASAASDYDISNPGALGLFSSPSRIHPKIVPGAEVLGVVRKRGDGEIDPDFPRGWDVEGDVAQAQGAFYKSTFGDGHLRVHVNGVPRGRLCGTAGCVIPSEHSGTADIRIGGEGWGDDRLNFGTYKWGRFILAIATNSLTVDANSIKPPLAGNKIAFEKSGTRVVHPITNVVFGAEYVDGTGRTILPATVTVETPPTLDATWDIQNLATTPKQTLQPATLSGGARGFLIQAAAPFLVGPTVAEDMRGCVYRGQNPNSPAHRNQGGFRGGGLIGPLYAKNIATDYIDKANGAIVWRMIDSAVPVPDVDPITHCTTVLDEYGFNAVLAEAVPTFFPAGLILLRGGTQRLIHPRTIANPSNAGNFDLVAIAAPLEIAWLNTDAFAWLKARLTLGATLKIGNIAPYTLKQLNDPAADVTINTNLYGRLWINAPLGANRNFILSRGLPQDRFLRVRHAGSGGSAVIKDEGGTILDTIAPGGEKTFDLDATATLPRWY